MAGDRPNDDRELMSGLKDPYFAAGTQLSFGAMSGL